MSQEKNPFKWKHGKASIRFSNPQITFFPGAFEEKQEQVTMNDVMYYYYTVTLRNKRLKKVFHTHDFPKVQELPRMIDHLLTVDMEKLGAVIEEYQRGGFHRKIRYYQTFLEDSFGMHMEYFMRFERYDYEVKQDSDEPTQRFTEYRLLIGEPVNPYAEDDCADCFYLYQLQAEDLIRLKEVAETFLAHSLKVEIQRELTELKENLEI